MALVRNMDDAKVLVDLFLADAIEKPEENGCPTNISWVKTGHSTTGYVFSALAQDIDADIETVWQVVKDVLQYSAFSNGSITVQNKEIKFGAAIGFDICVKGSCIDTHIPHSDEVISVVDDENKILGWEREVPFTSKLKKSYHVLERLPDDPKQTRSYIALRVPSGFTGFCTNLFYRKDIEQAFNDLHLGIKHEAELRAQTKTLL